MSAVIDFKVEVGQLAQHSNGALYEVLARQFQSEERGPYLLLKTKGWVSAAEVKHYAYNR